MKWGFKRAFLRCALLFVAGAVLQSIIGKADKSILSFPWGVVLALNYVYILVLLIAKSDMWLWVRKLYDHHACIASISSLLLMTVIFGLTGQDDSTDGLTGLLGFRDMSSSWSFIMLWIYFITILGLQTIEGLWKWRSRRKVPLIFHTAVFIVLAAGLLSSGDKERVRVSLSIGYPVHEGNTPDGMRTHLPFTITLKDFMLEEYPPELQLLDLSSGMFSDESIYLEGEMTESSLGCWNIRINENLDMAGYKEMDSGYIAMEHVGAAPAVYVIAEDTRTGEMTEGWVSCGSHIFRPSILELTDSMALAMPQREVKSFRSEILIWDGKEADLCNIEVNKPARKGIWSIYQIGYDSSRGRWSTTSVLECVKDGWYPMIQVCLWLILAVSACMIIFSGGKRRKVEEDRG